MKRSITTILLVLTALIVSIGFSACSSGSQDNGGVSEPGINEVAGGDQGGGAVGGELPAAGSVVQGSVEEMRDGARLSMAYDAAIDSFVGSVENTTGSMLCGVRVKIELSSGTELGHTAPTMLPSGEAFEFAVPARGTISEDWIAFTETAPCP